MTTISPEALTDLLFRLADDELLVGHRNSEWTGVAPIIEEDIAFSSMAQDEMGHAQAYYTILHEALGQDAPDKLAFLRNPEDFRSAFLAEMKRADWAHALMRQFLYDTAEHIRVEAYKTHPFEPLAQVARKISGEEKYHLMHARMWVTKLGNATDESRQKMQNALDSLWPYALGLFETPKREQPEPFDENTLRQQWLDFACPLLQTASLKPTAEEFDGQWRTTVDAKTGRYGQPAEDRIDLLNAMQQVYRIDPEAEW